MSLQEIYTHEVKPFAVIHSDPCDPLPDYYINYLWLKFALDIGDITKANQLKLLINSHYGKLAK